MSKIKYFEEQKISVYIYGEFFEKHHEKHLLIVNAEEHSIYGFDGYPIPGTKGLRNRSDRKVVKEWILSNKEKLDAAWENINNGINPGIID